MQKTPTGLGTAGKRLWKDIVSPLSGPDSDPDDPFELTAREVSWLTQACKLQDRLAQMNEILDRDGLVAAGYKGQPVKHPMLDASVTVANAIAALLAKLQLPEDVDDDDPAGAIAISFGQPRSVQARKAANTRWGNNRG
jgi:P27 family predicted phage terminase small subunit